MPDKLNQTTRTTLKRLPSRGSYDREVIYGILDEALICHVGFVVDGQPFVIPTGFAREGDMLFIHGSAASRFIRTLATEVEVCLTVTLVDGLVLARSAFHHSINFRSVVVFGRAAAIEDENEKARALHAFTEHFVRGRWNDVRPPSLSELKKTSVLSLSLLEASAKIRIGNPIDDEEDYELDVWAGVIPLNLVAGAPIDDGRIKESISTPEYASAYARDSRLRTTLESDTHR